MQFLVLSSYGKSFWSFVYVIMDRVGAGISTLISIPKGLDPYLFFCRKREKTTSLKGEMDGTVFIYRHSRHFFLCKKMIKILFTFCTGV